jgi:hypothetical protein
MSAEVDIKAPEEKGTLKEITVLFTYPLSFF